MKLNEAIIKRINDICKEKKISVCEAALGGGKSPSALYDLVKGRTQCSKVTTIQSFCEGAGITLSEFFNSEYFNSLVAKYSNYGRAAEYGGVIPALRSMMKSNI